MSRVIAAGLVLWLGTWLSPVGLTAQPTTPRIETVPGMPPIVDPRDLYSETQASKLSPAVTSEGRRGEVQIRYTVTRPFTGVNEERRP